MKFKFSLETVLKQRRILEENAARALAGLELKIKNEREKFDQFESLREKDLQTSLEALAQGLPVAEMELARFREVKLMYEVNLIRESLEVLKQDKTVKEADLLSRVKDRRLLEKVREQHLQEWLQEQGLQERKELDEIAVIRAGRRKN